MKARFVGAALLFVLTVTVTGTGPTPDYVRLDGDLNALRTAFNRDMGKVRLVVYVAPTCGGCLRTVDQIQDHVLSEIEDPGLSAHIIWVRKNGARERHLERVLRLATDSRATHYWDGGDGALRRFDELLSIGGSPCAGAALLYGPEARWEGGSPTRPVYWQDAHPELQRSDAPTMDGERLATEVRRLLTTR